MSQHFPPISWLDNFDGNVCLQRNGAKKRIVNLNQVSEMVCQRIQPAESVCPYVKVHFGKVTQGALLDSGAVRSLISGSFFQKLQDVKAVKEMRSCNFTCRTASLAPLPIQCLARVQMKLDGFSWLCDFLVAPGLGLPCILGADFIFRSGMVVDLGSQRAYFKFRRSQVVPVFFSKADAEREVEVIGDIEITPPVDTDGLSHLSAREATAIRELCNKFPDVLTPVPGVTHLLEYEIRLTDSRPVRSHPYKLAPPKMEEMRKMIKQLLEQGIIEPSTSSFSSPAFLVPKSNGKSRLVIDYKKLNDQIEIDSVPLPDLHSAFDWFGKAKFFSIIDLNQAYHQIPLKAESRPLTAFCVPWNLYQFRRVPMGLAVGAQTLTRLLDSLFHDVKFRYVFNYLDDLLVYSETFEDHLRQLEEVFTRLKKAKLTVNPAKLQYARSEISFLGHLVSSKGVRIDPDRVQGIRDFPPPRDAKGISRFVGMVNFYRRFIPNVAELAAPLNQLRRKGEKWQWGPPQQEAFDKLKECIMQPPVLRMPDFGKPFILQTDASSMAVAAVLSQEFDGARQPIAFASRTLTPQERKSSSVYELECLAVLFGTEKFRRFLEHSEFLLETDNQALSWLLAHPRQLGKIGRWVVKLAALKFKVQHIRGTQNILADALSRMFHEAGTTDEGGMVTSVLLEFPLAFSDILSHQMEDDELRDIIQRLQSGEDRTPYFLSKGALCCRARRQGPRLVLPSKLIPMVFAYYHDSPIGGHLGIHKTITRIRKEFIWRGMDRDIAERVRNCRLCGLSKPAQNTKYGLLSSGVADRPMQTLHIDYVGAFPRSKDGNSILLVCVDAFTKFCWLLPLRRATAPITIRALQNHIFQHFGVPANIVSDNGSQFTSKDFQRMNFLHGITHVTMSPYYPRPSHAERFNRNLRSALIAYHAEKQDTWDRNLRWLQLAFNSSLHESHKNVPYELMFGQRPNNPLSNLWRIEDLLPAPGAVDLKKTWEAARRNLLRAREQVRKKYNKGRRPNPFKVGMLVYLETHPLSSAADKRMAKLCHRWTGPHRILRMLTPVTVELGEVGNDGKIFRKAHVSQLKMYRGAALETG